MSWKTWVLFVGLLWIYFVCIACKESPGKCKNRDIVKNLTRCLEKRTHFVIADNFSGFITADTHLNKSQDCILFVQKNVTRKEYFGEKFPEIMEYKGSSVLRVSKWYIEKQKPLFVPEGRQCNFTVLDSEGSSQITCLKNMFEDVCLATCKNFTYDENNCKNESQNKYILNLTSSECLNCNNPVKLPEITKTSDHWSNEEGKNLNAAEAAQVMNDMANLATSIDGDSAALIFGGGVSGILLKQTDPEDLHEVSFSYGSPNDSMQIIEDRDILAGSRSVTLSKEAFEKAFSLNVSEPFVAILRFNNLASDELNSIILGNEVIAVEMGVMITNLTDNISINFKNVEYKGTPSCHSWNGDGSRPNWTVDGCQTIRNGSNITCECSHLTFFAILLADPNESISGPDLKSLTIITQVGCGLSMFFLSIVLFMHFLLRKTKASPETRILIHLASAMFLLNFTFLINNYVAKGKNHIGCQIMAALMHYFMLTTFTWFAVQAFHSCLNLYQGGTILIRRYMLKISITSWVLPSIVGIVLFSLGKYGEQVISTNDTEADETICWITDIDVHYIVNIGYYALVFLFTFTTFIIVVYWLFLLKRTRSQTSSAGISTSRKGIAIILGLCLMMGLTWGFAFFAYGVLRIPAYYIFTVLNSFQGFFLFIYYYNTSHSGQKISGQDVPVSSSTIQSSLYSNENPYINFKKESPGDMCLKGDDGQLKA